ncbi:bifunctional 4-hydroxy-2-oxoglutarate aldolase/2-dehydro-3-deoxy-phosphogluconate aldolase [Verminephrobacter aporrectodeae subsp. tuberculatae]|uniref:bifunctional 4-hydroxy-2-oxoglutarate aldolase/2-dehydro-3-deoxy-phosphogluconate aldolase n=1 Tax=Verminephrobacter aporrectodeae TaxID=1110389 RepID=UPI002244AB0B|nr:bifunctional 4-hydroxy-2-oxoglutarate aldolase/2-dehydro-3-deoxy-phosphogluconate aldolase [Verminephrobacter aporrectodeae]MCW8166564.1 bifunctional 4-hydroxy-2-oxoglutarate aldolase/2-dehydro-3-deoxy-phosphogluconate aldolase [Verminephrobacter aporrectodeae subsp. tuberculatae]MCW8170837.1 bifunctional 4-hydroxy-2-oxoglutarate aldolase/2-dehydro-3-deoxy-phosphogluconate aldolase [Verminephrobacter aporrectodeae subsp. tuberculatae]
MAVTPATPLDIASHGPVIPVIVIEHVHDALPLAEALLAGGVQVLEVTLRTAAGLPAIEAIARQLPQAVVGVGTVLDADDARRASAAGARFAVSPGYTQQVGDACKALKLPLLPGVATSSEIMAALSDGFSFLKLFPAEAAGGIPLLKSWASPFGQVSFCPTGGIGPATAPDYLALPNVRCVGGSWLTPADAVRSGDWARITALARAAQALRGAM